VNELLQQIRGEFARLDRINAPAVPRVARDVYARVKRWDLADRDRFVHALWESRKLEEAELAIYVYRRFARQCGAREFRMFTGWLDRYVNEWGLTDGLSLWLLGASIGNHPSLIAKLHPWTRSENRWKRRAAAVAMVPSARRGLHTREIFRIATPLMPDDDHMVRKGVGWLLKETYPKKPAETVRFLLPWRGKAPRLTLRYAAEKMTAADRARVLAIP
jgi:3-methyladenine DNA glycosylase AlkD